MMRGALHDEIVRTTQLPDERDQASSSSADYNTIVTADGGEIPHQIPLEIVTEEEMALIDAAMVSARGMIRASSFLGSRSSPSALASLRRCRNSFRPVSPSQDIEDFDSRQSQPKPSPLKLFRNRRALSVTDITATEWCEKRMEFILLHGKPEKTKAMKAGCDRHVQLEEEITTKVEIRIRSVEDSWAVRLLNFAYGTQQLLFDGLTRELPVLGMIQGIWMVGVIDEIRIPADETFQWPLLVDTKTRYKATLPSEAQKRNGRLQLMCYKYLWDNMVAHDFPRSDFYRHFELDPLSSLSEDVLDFSARLGLHAKTLDAIVSCFCHHCQLLQLSQQKLILRYEFQGNHSLLEEYVFEYDGDWFQSQMMGSLAFWSGEKEASLVTQDEEWKCRFCDFCSICPVSLKPDRLNPKTST